MLKTNKNHRISQINMGEPNLEKKSYSKATQESS